MKTVKQLAAELNTSKSTLHRLIHDNNIETIQQGNKRLIDETIETAIIKAFHEKTLQGETIQNDSETVQKRFKNDSKTFHRNDIETIQSEHIESLKAQVQLLNEQLTVKDKQLTAAQAQINNLIDTIHELTIALKAAQALHGIDKQQKAIEVKQVKTDPKTHTELQTQKPKQEPNRQRKLSDRIKAFFK